MSDEKYPKLWLLVFACAVPYMNLLVPILVANITYFLGTFLSMWKNRISTYMLMCMLILIWTIDLRKKQWLVNPNASLQMLKYQFNSAYLLLYCLLVETQEFVAYARKCCRAELSKTYSVTMFYNSFNPNWRSDCWWKWYYSNASDSWGYIEESRW